MNKNIKRVPKILVHFMKLKRKHISFFYIHHKDRKRANGTSNGKKKPSAN